jgi:hypothetical protein
MMNKRKVKEAVKCVLQYGWMWGNPKHITRDGWDALHEFYKEELNGGKDFKPDKNNRAKGGT